MRQYNYFPQQCILKKRWKPRKLDEQMSGPYRVLQTHVNGTVTIELRPGVSERLLYYKRLKGVGVGVGVYRKYIR